MAVELYDDFNRSDRDLDSGDACSGGQGAWYADRFIRNLAASIASAVGVVSGNEGSFLDLDSPFEVGRAEITIVSGPDVYLLINYVSQSGFHGVCARVATDEKMRLVQFQNGTGTTIDTGTTTIQAGDAIAVEVTTSGHAIGEIDAGAVGSWSTEVEGDLTTQSGDIAMRGMSAETVVDLKGPAASGTPTPTPTPRTPTPTPRTPTPTPRTPTPTPRTPTPTPRTPTPTPRTPTPTPTPTPRTPTPTPRTPTPTPRTPTPTPRTPTPTPTPRTPTPTPRTPTPTPTPRTPTPTPRTPTPSPSPTPTPTPRTPTPTPRTPTPTPSPSPTPTPTPRTPTPTPTPSPTPTPAGDPTLFLQVTEHLALEVSEGPSLQVGTGP